MLHEISDNDWFEFQFDPERAFRDYGIRVPGFPSAATQISFTGMAGRPNLEVAFSFYRYAPEIAGIGNIEAPRILDFGAGWGRVARFFLRDARPEDITASDTMSLAINCLRETGAPFRMIHNPPAPPIPDFEQSFDLIYAYSVFSHFSESYTRQWLDYLLGHLRPGGHFVLTTRGHRFIRDQEAIRAQATQTLSADHDAVSVADYLETLRRALPQPVIMEERLQAGEFQFYPIGHAELIEECTGETVIPQAWFERHYSPVVGFTEDVPKVDQAVVTLRKRF